MEIKTKQYSEETTKIINRLKRIEGQVRGIRKMVCDERGCEDLLTQLSAVDKSIKSLSQIVLEEHIRTNVADNLAKGNHDVIDEVIQILRRFQ